MIGFLQGEILFSDGTEVIVQTTSGIGYQVYYNNVLAEGSKAALFISHVIKEADQELYAFHTLREKKLFELLTSVKGVGPKSAYALLGSIGAVQTIDAILMEDKKSLTKAPGVGPKAAAQMILDLSGKIQKIKMYTNRKTIAKEVDASEVTLEKIPQMEIFEAYNVDANESAVSDNKILEETLMACKELGFKEDKIVPIAHKLLNENSINRPEQLVHLVLKEV